MLMNIYIHWDIRRRKKSQNTSLFLFGCIAILEIHFNCNHHRVLFLTVWYYNGKVCRCGESFSLLNENEYWSRRIDWILNAADWSWKKSDVSDLVRVMAIQISRTNMGLLSMNFTARRSWQIPPQNFYYIYINDSWFMFLFSCEDLDILNWNMWHTNISRYTSQVFSDFFFPFIE